MKFRAKKRLPLIQKSFQFREFGFKNKHDRRVLCRATKPLIKKYPRQHSKNRKSAKSSKADIGGMQGLEGFVENTQN